MIVSYLEGAKAFANLSVTLSNGTTLSGSALPAVYQISTDSMSARYDQTSGMVEVMAPYPMSPPPVGIVGTVTNATLRIDDPASGGLGQLDYILPFQIIIAAPGKAAS